jgi:hypothetical protein
MSKVLEFASLTGAAIGVLESWTRRRVPGASGFGNAMAKIDLELLARQI